MNRQKMDGLRLQKGKVFILICAIVALVGMTVDFISAFLVFDFDGPSFRFRTDPYSLLWYLASAMMVVALVLILLAVVRLCKTETISNLLPIGYILIAVSSLMGIGYSFLMGYVMSFNLLMQSFLMQSFLMVASILVAVSAWRGFSMKLAVIISTALAGLVALLQFIEFLVGSFAWLVVDFPLIAVLNLIYYLALPVMLALPILLVIFCRRADWQQPFNSMPGVYGFVGTGNAEQDLRQLQYNLQMGYITQEEYTARRTEIINSL